MFEVLAIVVYFGLLLGVVAKGRKKALSQNDFVIGSRSLSRWKTALAAHASDMSNWLLMAYPAMIFLNGGRHIWAAIGLTLMMWLNWVWIAPKVRKATEKSDSVTLIDFFEKRLGGDWPVGRLVTSGMLLLFYTVYVAGALFGMGFLIQCLFGAPYWVGVVCGLAVILPYVLIGGFLTLAQVDLYQGIFLLGVLIFVPVFVAKGMGVGNVFEGFAAQGKSLSLFDGSMVANLMLMLGWGLGYFGQPHIVSKFMGIRDVEEIKASKRIGITWMILSLGAATAVGVVGVAFFGTGLGNPEQVFIEMVRQVFPPFVAGLFLCAIIAAIINAVSSMLLVLSSTLSEDIYGRFVKKGASSKEKLLVARLSCVGVAILAMGISLSSAATIDQLVLYAWSGLGASFGPLLIMALYSKRLSPRGAWAGMVAGGGCVALWPWIGFGDIPALVVAFPLALGVIWSVSRVGSQEDVVEI